MGKNPKQVANDTVQKIVKDLLEIPREVSLTQHEVIKIITQHINDAYVEVRVEDKTALYKALSILLHPDKFARFHPRLHSYLEQLKIADEPFKILNKQNTKHLLNDVNNNPTDGFNSFLQYLFHLMSSMEESLNRYYQPFRFLAKSIYWTLFAFTVVTGVVGVVAQTLSSIVLGIASFIVNLTLNLITKNQYAKEVSDYIEPNFVEHQKEYLKNLREYSVTALKSQNKESEAATVQEMSDDNFLEQLIQSEFQQVIHSGFFVSDEEALINEIREKHQQNIKNSVSINDFTRIKLISISLYKAITKPLDEVEGSKFISLFFVRPLQVIASPFILGAAILIELSRYAITGIVLSGVVISSLALVSALALLNAPLYALDLCRYTARKIQGCIWSNESSEEFHNRGPRSLLMLEWHHDQDKSFSVSEKPPIHQDPLFSTSKQEMKPDRFEASEGLSLGC